MTDVEILRELDVLQAAGVGGVEINTIARPVGPKSKTPCHAWLSPEWIEMVAVAARGARARGMTADLMVGAGWPWGGRFLEATEQTQRVLLIKKDVSGPSSFRASVVELAQRGLGFSKTRQLSIRPQLLFLRLRRARLERFEPGRDLRPEGAGEDDQDRIRVDIPAGEHVLYIGVRVTGYAEVALGAPGADGPVLNHLDARAVRGYLDRLSSALEPYFEGGLSSALRAAFVDSIELESANWTHDFEVEFERRRGYRLMPYLPYVLDLDGAQARTSFAETIRRARYDFHRTIVELFHERFLMTYAAWCREHGLLSRAQAYGRQVHPLDGSLLVDLPEGESWLGAYHDRTTSEPTVVNRFVASAARLRGRRLVSHEAMTNVFPFRATLSDMKGLLDRSLLSGVNHPILHGFNYSPSGLGFPGWIRFGTWLSERNPWWRHFRRFTDYSARLTTVLGASASVADLAVLAARADEWAGGPLLYQPFPEVSVPWYQYALPDALAAAGYSADFVSEGVVQTATAANGVLRHGPRTWRGLLVLGDRSMAPKTMQKIALFALSGGRVVFVGRVPERAPGLKGATAEDRKVQRLAKLILSAPKQQVSVVPAPPGGPPGVFGARRANVPRYARRGLLQWVLTRLPAFDLQPTVSVEAPHVSVGQVHHRRGRQDIVLFANSSATETVVLRVGGFRRAEGRAGGGAAVDGGSGDAGPGSSEPSAGMRPWRWDAETGRRWPLATNDAGKFWLRLEPAEAALVVTEPAREGPPAGPGAAEPELRPFASPLEWRKLSRAWRVTFRPSFGGRAFSRTMDLMDLSLSRRREISTFAGEATYRARFRVDEDRYDVVDLGTVHGTSEVKLNGRSLGVRWWGAHRYDVAGLLRKGWNRLEVTVTVVAANYARSRRNNKAAQVWSSWYPPIPTGLMGPVRLVRTYRTRQTAR